MKKIIEDERVLAQRRKIGNDAFQLLWFVLIISVLIQQYVFDAPFSQYCVEFICFIVSSIYILIRNIYAGNDVYGPKASSKKIISINALVIGGSISITLTALNYEKNENLKNVDLLEILGSALITFIVAAAVAYLVGTFIDQTNRKKQASIEAKFDEDEKA